MKIEREMREREAALEKESQRLMEEWEAATSDIERERFNRPREGMDEVRIWTALLAGFLLASAIFIIFILLT